MVRAAGGARHAVQLLANHALGAWTLLLAAGGMGLRPLDAAQCCRGVVDDALAIGDLVGRSVLQPRCLRLLRACSDRISDYRRDPVLHCARSPSSIAGAFSERGGSDWAGAIILWALTAKP